MTSLVEPAPVLEPEPEEPGWEYAVGQEIAPGLHAWELLGGGYRFETWLAWSTEHWAAVTVKLPRPSRVQSERARASLLREAQALRDLHHPSFQRLLEERIDAPVPLLVYEYVEGPTLSDLVDDEPLSPIDTVLVGLQLAACLHYLHSRGLVHIDLKPGNVLLRDGRVVLIDLGLSRPIGTPNPPGNPRGTANYMAPEQCRKAPADPRMDLFGLGTVLYELATAELAFRQPEGQEDVYAQLEQAPVPAPDLVEDFPGDLWAVLQWLLQPDPDQRAQTATDVLTALNGLIPEDDEGLWPAWVTRLLADTTAAPARTS